MRINFGDVGADTLGHIAEAMNGLHMPNMEALGLSNIREIKGIKKVDQDQKPITEKCKKLQ